MHCNWAAGQTISYSPAPYGTVTSSGAEGQKTHNFLHMIFPFFFKYVYLLKEQEDEIKTNVYENTYYNETIINCKIQY